MNWERLPKCFSLVTPLEIPCVHVWVDHAMVNIIRSKVDCVFKIFRSVDLNFFLLHLTLMNFLPYLTQMLPTISYLWITCGWIAWRQYHLPCPPYNMKRKTYEHNWTDFYVDKRSASDQQEKGGNRPFHSSILSVWQLILRSEPRNQLLYPIHVAIALHKAAKLWSKV